jgi:hypothetical protein
MAAPVLTPSPAFSDDDTGGSAHHLQNHLSIIDVSVFFDTLIKVYNCLEQSARTLAADIPSLAPEVIADSCRRLRDDQQLLTTKDCQVIDVLNLAWDYLATSGYIPQYRNALSAAVQAVDAVHQQLLTVRQSLEAATPCLECRDATDLS